MLPPACPDKASESPLPTLESNGALVAPRDAEALAVEVRRYLDDAALRAETGRRARATVVEKFRTDHTIARYLELYRELTERAA